MTSTDVDYLHLHLLLRLFILAAESSSIPVGALRAVLGVPPTQRHEHYAHSREICISILRGKKGTATVHRSAAVLFPSRIFYNDHVRIGHDSLSLLRPLDRVTHECNIRSGKKSKSDLYLSLLSGSSRLGPAIFHLCLCPISSRVRVCLSRPFIPLHS